MEVMWSVFPCSIEMMDYMRPENEVCFAPSTDVEEVVVSIIADDDFEESSELFLLQLSGRTVAYPVQVRFPIARSVATVTIVENPGTMPNRISLAWAARKAYLFWRN